MDERNIVLYERALQDLLQTVRQQVSYHKQSIASNNTTIAYLTELYQKGSLSLDVLQSDIKHIQNQNNTYLSEIRSMENFIADPDEYDIPNFIYRRYDTTVNTFYRYRKLHFSNPNARFQMIFTDYTIISLKSMLDAYDRKKKSNTEILDCFDEDMHYNAEERKYMWKKLCAGTLEPNIKNTLVNWDDPDMINAIYRAFHEIQQDVEVIGNHMSMMDKDIRIQNILLCRDTIAWYNTVSMIVLVGRWLEWYHHMIQYCDLYTKFCNTYPSLPNMQCATCGAFYHTKFTIGLDDDRGLYIKKTDYMEEFNGMNLRCDVPYNGNVCQCGNNQWNYVCDRDG